MPRRRAERQQEKEAFLQQNPELITYTTRIEVEEANNPMEPPEAVFSQDGGAFFEVETRGGFESSPSFDLVDQINGPGFNIIGFPDVGGIIPLPPLPVQQEDLMFEVPFLLGFPIGITDNGFGIASEFEGEDDGPKVAMKIGEDEEPIPEGFDTVDEGEVFSVMVSPNAGNPQFMGEDDDDEGGLSFGIDFTASGRGSVMVALYGDDGPTPLHTESFNIPFGTSPDDVLNFEVDAPDGDLFTFADVSTTGGASISIVGVDLETNFQGMLMDPT